VGNFTFSPRMSRRAGVARHKFCVPGIIFTLFVGRHVPSESFHLGVAPNARTAAYGPLETDDWYVQCVDSVAASSGRARIAGAS
jgi:hypothetical protein